MVPNWLQLKLINYCIVFPIDILTQSLYNVIVESDRCIQTTVKSAWYRRHTTVVPPAKPTDESKYETVEGLLQISKMNIVNLMNECVCLNERIHVPESIYLLKLREIKFRVIPC